MAAVLLVAACTTRAPEEAVDEAPVMTLLPAGFAEVPGWTNDDQGGALTAFLISCARLETLPSDRSMGVLPAAGVVGDWLPACRAAKNVPDGGARHFFETWFRPWAVDDRGGDQGLMTGYYEPLLQGSLVRDATYAYPLYAKPDDIITVDLGAFSEDLDGRSISGQLDGGTLIPYHDRAAIDDGALAARDLEIVWVDDPIAAFFLHIQGSGRVALDDGTQLRVGYAGQNGRPYFAIGRDLVARGELTKEEVSLQSIRDWLKAHPGEAATVMEKNPSYIFFSVLDGPGPLGAQGVPLTPERSLAVDRDYVPLGLPVWLETTLPDDTPYRRLMIAQDTGGAINGPIRGDVFFGAGQRAEDLAGHMKQDGRFWLLLPSLVPSGEFAAVVP